MSATSMTYTTYTTYTTSMTYTAYARTRLFAMSLVILFLFLLGANRAAAQVAQHAVCTAARTTNCLLETGSTGSVAIGTPLPTAVGNSGVLVPVVISTSTPIVPAVTGFYLNNNAGAITYNLPAITSANIGLQMCFRNATTRTGAITIKAPASTYIDVVGTNGSVTGTYVSSGALGDSACVVAISTTQYLAYSGMGLWTNN